MASGSGEATVDDAVPTVRLRAALALAQVNDAKGVAGLVTLLGDLQVEEAHTALDVLYNLAGDKAPKVTPGTDAASRGKCRDAWKTWWDGTEGVGLLDEFKKRTLNDGDREKWRRQETVRQQLFPERLPEVPQRPDTRLLSKRASLSHIFLNARSASRRPCQLGLRRHLAGADRYHESILGRRHRAVVVGRERTGRVVGTVEVDEIAAVLKGIDIKVTTDVIGLAAVCSVFEEDL